MIVLDEQLGLRRIADEIAQWYSGSVVNIKEFRPLKQILDPQIPSLLLEVKQPTLVTVNYLDFWKKSFLHAGYCIICLKLESSQNLLVPGLVRDILQMPRFKTKALRMGCVISWRDGIVTYYERDHR